MRRVITQIGQSIYEWLFTRQAQDNMVALGKLASALLGTGTMVNGLAVTPTAPASMQVNVGPGEIYALAALESTAYGTLAADTTHQVVKQGILLDATQLSCAAPPTAGQSVNYLIQASFAEQDISIDPTTGTSPVVLQYYNASNPTQPWSGPNNSGQTSNTFRQGSVVLSSKAGIAATTGSQTTPSPDAGCVGLYVVTVANGQTTITSANISQYASAPFINTTLLGQNPGFSVPLTVSPATQSQHAMQLGQATGRLIGVQIFSAVGTSTYTPSPGTASVVVEVQGGGGQGAGCVASSVGNVVFGGGGAAGARAVGRFTAGFSGVAVTVGAGGSTGGAGASGQTGGTSSFGALISAPGGAGAAPQPVAAAPVVSSAAAGGSVASGGNIYNGTTIGGGNGVFGTNSNGFSGRGGNSYYGNGGDATYAAGNGNAAIGYGAGGSGAVSFNGTGAAAAGGAGKAGIVIVWEFA